MCDCDELRGGDKPRFSVDGLRWRPGLPFLACMDMISLWIQIKNRFFISTVSRREKETVIEARSPFLLLKSCELVCCIINTMTTTTVLLCRLWFACIVELNTTAVVVCVGRTGARAVHPWGQAGDDPQGALEGVSGGQGSWGALGVLLRVQRCGELSAQEGGTNAASFPA